MATMFQLDLFEDTDMSILKDRMDKVERSADKCRKKQFADIGELRKIVIDLEARLSIVERHICQLS